MLPLRGSLTGSVTDEGRKRGNTDTKGRRSGRRGRLHDVYCVSSGGGNEFFKSATNIFEAAFNDGWSPGADESTDP
jgi:hypothetical protein